MKEIPTDYVRVLGAHSASVISRYRAELLTAEEAFLSIYERCIELEEVHRKEEKRKMIKEIISRQKEGMTEL